MGLTANILWQIWKDRNKRGFEHHTGSHPCSVIQKAHKEWLELEDLEPMKNSRSTTETLTTLEEDCHAQQSQDLIILKMATRRSQKHAVLGIGVDISKMQTEAKELWALKDRSSGDQNIDDAAAVQLILCKALDRHWSNISIQIHNKDLLKRLKFGKSSDCRLTTILENILCLKSLFRVCSFSLVNYDDKDVCANISSYALGILLDEESLIPPCH